MSDAEVPEADALEQSAAVEPDAQADLGEVPAVDPEAPEADALEQSAAVRASGPASASVGMEVPEADAQEQAAEVGDDDGRDRSP